MTRGETNPKVDEFLRRAEKWPDEIAKLRAIFLACGLTEELKWGQPCYAFQGHNIAIVGEFKDYCSLLFVKGALLKDPHGILIRQTENVQAARQLRFTSVQQIVDVEPFLKAYIEEAIEVEKAGLKVPRKETSAFAMPEEFKSKLDEAPILKAAFEALTPGRQRAYLLYFASAKQAKTREARVEKYMPHILAGKGLDD